MNLEVAHKHSAVIAGRGLEYERLDQLAIDLLLDVR